MKRTWDGHDRWTYVLSLAWSLVGVISLVNGATLFALPMFMVALHTATQPLHRRNAHNVGWLTGRAALSGAIAQGCAHGQTVEDTLMLECARDMLGLEGER